MANPKVKVGDKVLVLQSKNTSSMMNNKIYTVTSERGPGNNSIKVIGDDGQLRSLFYSGPADVFVIADKEQILKHYADMKTDLEDQMEAVTKKIEFITKYDSEEEFVADKLDQLMQVEGTSKKARLKKMAAILKELKSSNIL